MVRLACSRVFAELGESNLVEAVGVAHHGAGDVGAHTPFGDRGAGLAGYGEVVGRGAG